MKNYFLNICMSFSCLAAACPFTCCSGWEIEISEEDYGRFSRIEPDWLRELIKDNIRKKDNRYFFKRKEDGACAMLEEDGLCKIVKNTSEKTLCNTCRKFPRVFRVLEDHSTVFSMAASCPVVAQAIYHGQISLYAEASDGLQMVSFEEIPGYKEIYRFCQDKIKNTFEGRKEREKYAYLSEQFDFLAERLIDVLLSSKTHWKGVLIDLLSFYEVEWSQEKVLELIQNFWMEQKGHLEQIKTSYVSYRIYSRWLEEPEKSSKKQGENVYGELLLLCFLGFLMFQREGRMQEKEWIFIICLTYRITAHEKTAGF